MRKYYHNKGVKKFQTNFKGQIYGLMPYDDSKTYLLMTNSKNTEDSIEITEEWNGQYNTDRGNGFLLW